MSLPLAEIIRIAAAAVGVVGTATAGPLGAIGAAALSELANGLDREDDEPEPIRKMRKKRREDWIKFCVKLEKQKQDKLKKYPAAARPSIGAVLSEADGASLRALIRGTIFETEDRDPGEQEINIYSEAVSAAARGKL